MNVADGVLGGRAAREVDATPRGTSHEGSRLGGHMRRTRAACKEQSHCQGRSEGRSHSARGKCKEDPADAHPPDGWIEGSRGPTMGRNPGHIQSPLRFRGEWQRLWPQEVLELPGWNDAQFLGGPSLEGSVESGRFAEVSLGHVGLDKHPPRTLA